MAWILLIVAGLLEVVWAYSMKRSEGFTVLAPAGVTIAAMVASFALLSISMRTLPLGTAYTVWTGIGAVGAFVVGITVLGEAVTPTRILAAILIVAGIVMMKLSNTGALLQARLVGEPAFRDLRAGIGDEDLRPGKDAGEGGEQRHLELLRRPCAADRAAGGRDDDRRLILQHRLVARP
jgi:quaternary ammonium compound-resistance protein SugE